MATPKHKTSKSRAASRKAANMKLATPALSKCENCGNNIEPGKDICPVCGKEQHNYDRPDYFGRNKRGRGSDLRVVIITLLVAVPCMVVLLIFALVR